MQLDDIVKKHADELSSLQENISNIRLDVQSITQENRYVREKIECISNSIQRLLEISSFFHEQKKDIEFVSKELSLIKEKTEKFELRFIIMDEKNKIKMSWKDFVTQQWWKIVLIVTPIVAFLFEVGVYLRNLPPNP